jgi:hypothetical protein
VRLAQGGHYLPPETYTRSQKVGEDLFTGIADLERISAEYRGGATINLPALQRSWPPLGRLCAGLEAQLDHAPHANVFMTPGNAAGFTPHYDVHEVFVLQVAGRKRWSLYEPPIRLPYRSQLFNPQDYSPPQPFAQLELAAGDLLYLPRGTVHSTTTSEEFSAHVTIDISVYTWVDLAREALQSSIDGEPLRRALPPGFAHRPGLMSPSWTCSRGCRRPSHARSGSRRTARASRRNSTASGTCCHRR